MSVSQSDRTARDLHGEPLTMLQHKILAVLHNAALKVEALAEKCSVDASRLYKPGGIKELRIRNLVQHKRQVGFYRPDAPPKQLMLQMPEVQITEGNSRNVSLSRGRSLEIGNIVLHHLGVRKGRTMLQIEIKMPPVRFYKTASNEVRNRKKVGAEPPKTG